MVIIKLSNTLVQTYVTDDLRGRLMGMFTFMFFRLMSLGSLVNRAIADKISEPLTIQINTLILLAAAVILVL
jgi:hypothetical protein